MMTIRKLQNGDETLLEQFLSGYAETGMFLRSNSRTVGLSYKDETYHGEYFGSFTDVEDINGVLAHYWNGNIMMQAVNESVLHELICTFREHVVRPVAGILGPSDQSQTVISGLGLSHAVFATNRDEGLYALDLDKLTFPSNFDVQRFRMVEAGDIGKSILTQWLKAYEIEALGSDDNEDLDAHVQSRVDRTVDGSDCWALVVDNQPVSLSGFNARLSDIVQIGPVWTPPEYRNNGYARALVALTLQKAQAQGVQKSILFTDNPAASKAYEAIGFEDVGLYRLALLKKPVDLHL